MAVNIRGRSFLKLLDYTPAEIRYLLDLSKKFQGYEARRCAPPLAGGEEHRAAV